MDISFSSSFNGSKVFLDPPASHNSFKTRKYNIASCRATKFFKTDTSNLYKVLSLHAEHVSADEIKKAYRTLALQYHPDVCPPSRKEECTHIFVELHRAYTVLSNPITRKKYDSELGITKLETTSTYGGASSRDRWEDQLCELRRRSDNRVAQKEGCWASRMRAESK